MSITRSRSPRAPVIELGGGKPTGVLIVAHGERGGRGDNVALQSLAERIAAALAAKAVVVPAVLKGGPSIGEAVARLRAAGCHALVVYPFFMSAGYFTRVLLPQRLDENCECLPWRMIEPLGVDAELPDLICRHAVAASKDPQHLLLVAHGSSKSRDSAAAAGRIADALHASEAFRSVQLAFLEEPPYLADVIAVSVGHRLVVGLFTGDGLHAREDVPAAIDATKHTYLGGVGTWPDVAGLVVSRLRGALDAELIATE